MKTVAISAGHQPGVDNGASSNGLYEAELTIKIADRVAEILRSHSVPTLYVPNDISLQATIQWINDRAKQINGCAVDIHINSGGGTGWEAFYYGEGKNESSKLAQFLVDALVEEAGLKSRGIKSEYSTRHGKLGFIHDTAPVASLVECGFIDTKADRELLSTDEGINRIAKGVARGILGYINVLWRPELLNPQKPTQQNSCEKEKQRIGELENQLKDEINHSKALQKDVEELSKKPREIIKEVIKEVVKIVEVPVEKIVEIEKKYEQIISKNKQLPTKPQEPISPKPLANYDTQKLILQIKEFLKRLFGL